MPPPPRTTASPPQIATKSLFLGPIVTLDAALSKTLHALKFPPRPLLLTLEYLADFRLFLPIAVAILAASPPSLHRPFGTSFITGLIIDLILVGAVKLIFRRPRPVYNKNMIAAVSADHYSFPSGHASRVFYVAALVSLSIGEGQFGDFTERWLVEKLAWWVWGWAGVTSGSRVLLGRHYVFDVVAGMFLGVFEAWFVFRFVKF